MATLAKGKIAFIVQRYGLEVNGGAELLCRRVAEHLTPYHEVHVITSCALDYIRWKNHYPAGTERINGVHVHRFPVDRPRNPRRFRRLTQRILSGRRPFFDQLEWMRRQGPFSTPLFDFIQHRRDDFEAFVFFTYLYPTTYFGLQLVPERSALVPAAHDEPFLYLDLFRPLFHLPRFLVYSTEAERRLVEQTFANGYLPNATVGIGIDVPAEVDGERFRQKYDLRPRFILYVGRVDNAKNCPELFDHFIRFKQEHPGDLKLVLMGKAVIPVPRHPDIVSLGYVSENDKFDGMAAASVLIVPSLYESLSIVMLEAWSVATPVLVNGWCDVLRENCERSRGGLYYQNYAEFVAKLECLLAESDLRDRLGEQGAGYVTRHYNWLDIERQYLGILEQIKAR
jgi:glycosyltransferase involved in cell wall biosynthesis